LLLRSAANSLLAAFAVVALGSASASAGILQATPSYQVWGNGTTSARTFDLDGRITAVTLGAGGKSYTFDAAGRITLVADTTDTSRN
jgi:YD repeat-containing protein